MDYGRPELVDRLAAAYAMGSLRGAARRRLAALLPAHPALRRAVAEWEARLGTLSVSVPPVTPPDRVWQAIERRLFAADAAAGPAPLRWWQRAAPWRALSGLTGIAAVALVVVASRTPDAPPPQAPIVVVLAASPEAARALNASGVASFVAAVSADGRALVLRPIEGEVALPSDRAFELWAVPAAGSPRSLGLVRASGPTTLVGDAILRGAAALAVSIEPAGGSPTGSPTGPVVSVGKLQS